MNNWRIGMEIVCINASNTDGIKESNIYTIKSLRGSICKCHEVDIDVGVVSKDEYEGRFHVYCPTCKTRIVDNNPTHWYSEARFAPLEYDQQAIEELLKITQPLSK